MSGDEVREGEVALSFDPATRTDAQLAFIGRLRSPWTARADCPRNMREARERAAGHIFRAEVDAPFRPALQGLDASAYVFLLTWLGEARRDLALQMPRHTRAPRGTFSLRSPVRPNPIGLHLVRLQGIDMAAGVLTLDALDVLDGTALLDIKPYLPSVDHAPGAAS